MSNTRPTVAMRIAPGEEIQSKGAIDRAGWQRGPWDEEPDTVIWIHDSGAVCFVYRNRSGALCGYVRVPDEHADSISAARDDFDTPGGVTFADSLFAGGRGIGFDCGHSWDFAPGYPSFGDVADYKRLDEVRRHTNRLADRVAAFVANGCKFISNTEGE